MHSRCLVQPASREDSESVEQEISTESHTAWKWPINGFYTALVGRQLDTQQASAHDHAMYAK